MLRKWLGTQLGSLEAIIYVCSFLWGVWLANPWWSQFRVQTGLAVMRAVGDSLVGTPYSHYLWGAIPLVVPILLLLSAIAPLTPRRRWAKRLLLFVMVAYWGFVTASFALVNWRTTGSAIYFQVVCLYTWLIIIHSRVSSYDD